MVGLAKWQLQHGCTFEECGPDACSVVVEGSTRPFTFRFRVHFAMLYLEMEGMLYSLLTVSAGKAETFY